MKDTQTDVLTCKLPAELVVDIFSRVLPPLRREEWSESSPPHTTLTPFFLGKICHSWRFVVWSNPMLWTYVTLTLNRKHYKTQVELLPGWLERSGSLPLAIIMRGRGGDETDWEFHPPREIVHQLAAVSERWKELDMFIPSPCGKDLASLRSRLPLLERLTIRSPDGVDLAPSIKLNFFREAPRLQDLSIGRLYGADATALPWCQLRCLYGQDYLTDDCYAMLSDAPALVVCRFKKVQQSSDFAYPSPQMIHLPHLQKFELSAIGNMVAVCFLNSLSLPSLVELELGLGFAFGDWKYFQISDITTLIKRSDCHLRKLTLTNIHIVENELLECLVYLSHLVELRIRAEYLFWESLPRTSISDKFLQALSDPSARPPEIRSLLPPNEALVPNLEVLEYTGPMREMQPETLRAMLEYRVNSGPPTSPSDASSSSQPTYTHSILARLRTFILESACPTTLTPPEVKTCLRSMTIDKGVDLTLAINGYHLTFESSSSLSIPYDEPDSDDDIADQLPICGPTTGTPSPILRTSSGTDTQTALEWVPNQDSSSNRHTGYGLPRVYPEPQVLLTRRSQTPGIPPPRRPLTNSTSKPSAISYA